MLISFSVDAMRPYVEAGIRQQRGEDIVGARVKRQTIRRRGPRAEQLLEQVSGRHFKHPGDLHLWWKSRTPARAFLGKVTGYRVYPLIITNDGHQLVIKGPGISAIFWDKHRIAEFKEFARADGFETPEEFRDYFVPNVGDRFDAVIFKW